MTGEGLSESTYQMLHAYFEEISGCELTVSRTLSLINLFGGWARVVDNVPPGDEIQHLLNTLALNTQRLNQEEREYQTIHAYLEEILRCKLTTPETLPLIDLLASEARVAGDVRPGDEVQYLLDTLSVVPLES